MANVKNGQLRVDSLQTVHNLFAIRLMIAGGIPKSFKLWQYFAFKRETTKNILIGPVIWRGLNS